MAGQTGTAAQGIHSVVSAHPVAAAALPEPGETMHGLSQQHMSAWRAFRHVGIIRQVGRCDGDHETCDRRRCNVGLYRVSERGYETAQNVIERRSLFLFDDGTGCGHPAFRNPRDMDGYTCTVDECDAEYSWAEVCEVTGYEPGEGQR
jgi:hypothetical protein